MKYKKSGNSFLLRLEKGEKVIEELTKFCVNNKIEGGKFFGIGAVSKAQLSYYSLKDYKYHSKNFEGEFEVLNITGNVSTVKRKPFIHSHLTLGGTDYKSFGGHLNEAITGPTLEIFFTPLEKTERKFNEETRLNLLDL